MSEQFSPQLHQHLYILQRYMRALDAGDPGALAELLRLAENDPALERLLLSVNEVYQSSADSVPSQQDLLRAQQIIAEAGRAAGLTLPAKGVAHSHSNNAPNYSRRRMHLLTQTSMQKEGKEMITNDSDTFKTELADQQFTLPSGRQRSGRRRYLWLQSLAAVLVVGVLLGGFLFVFTNRRTTTTFSPNSQSGGLLIETYYNAKAKTPVISALHTSGGSVAWTYTLPQFSTGPYASVNLPPEVVVSDGIIYANSANHMYVLNAQTGTLLWQKTLPGNNSSIQAGAILLAVDQDLLSVVSGNSAQPSTFYALNKQNGQIIWQHSIGYNNTFTVSNGVVYLEQSPTSAYGPGAIVALRESDGQQLWSAPVADPFSLIVAGNVLYAQTGHQQTPSDLGGNKENKQLVALNTANGTLLWSVSLVNDGASNLAFSNNLILLYRQTDQPRAAEFCAYRSSDGSQAWCTSGKEGPWDENTSTYMVANDTLYVSFLATSVDRVLAEPSHPGMAVEALNPQTGHASWSINLSNATSINAMTIAQKTLYLLENGKIVALDSATGRMLWTIAAGNGAQTLSAVNF